MGLKKRVKELEEENIFLKKTIKALEKRIDELEEIVKEKSYLVTLIPGNSSK